MEQGIAAEQLKAPEILVDAPVPGDAPNESSRSEKFLPFLKDTLELVRNVAFGLGVSSLAFIAHTQSWTMVPGVSAQRVGTVLAMLGGGYVGMSIMYFMLSHQPPKQYRRLGNFWWFIVLPFVALLTIAAIFMEGYQFAWQQRHSAPSEQLSQPPSAAPSNDTK